MTDVGATIAMGGRRPVPTLEAHQPPRFVRVTSGHVAGLVQRMMVAVVDYGTGTAAAIPGVTVAGKTGTAELANTTTSSGGSVTNANQLTDAWFVGYAPVGKPRIVVGALFPNQGAGGATAAPAVRDVLVAGLPGRPGPAPRRGDRPAGQQVRSRARSSPARPSAGRCAASAAGSSTPTSAA